MGDLARKVKFQDKETALFHFCTSNAHRLSTIKNADMIAVIKDGKIAEMGNHNTLKKSGGLYSELIKQQDTNS